MLWQVLITSIVDEVPVEELVLEAGGTLDRPISIAEKDAATMYWVGGMLLSQACDRELEVKMQHLRQSYGIGGVGAGWGAGWGAGSLHWAEDGLGSHMRLPFGALNIANKPVPSMAATLVQLELRSAAVLRDILQAQESGTIGSALLPDGIFFQFPEKEQPARFWHVFDLDCLRKLSGVVVYRRGSSSGFGTIRFSNGFSWPKVETPPVLTCCRMGDSMDSFVFKEYRGHGEDDGMMTEPGVGGGGDAAVGFRPIDPFDVPFEMLCLKWETECRGADGLGGASGKFVDTNQVLDEGIVYGLLGYIFSTDDDFFPALKSAIYASSRVLYKDSTSCVVSGGSGLPMLDDLSSEVARKYLAPEENEGDIRWCAKTRLNAYAVILRETAVDIAHEYFGGTTSLQEDVPRFLMKWEVAVAAVMQSMCTLFDVDDWVVDVGKRPEVRAIFGLLRSLVGSRRSQLATLAMLYTARWNVHVVAPDVL